MTKASTITIIVAIIIIGGLVYYFSEHNSDSSSKNENVSGTLFISIGDPSTTIEGVSEIRMELSGIELHNEESGWTKVSGDNKTYDLLALDTNGENKLYEKIQTTAADYDEIRADIAKVTVIKANGDETQATLPSNQFTVEGNINIDARTTSSVAFNFIADKSLHQTNEGEYVFAPVVKVIAKSDAEVNLDTSTDSVTSNGGNVTMNTEVGVDIDGTTKENFSLAGDANLEIINGVLQVVGSVNEESSSSNATDTQATSSSTTLHDSL